ncbi:MAG: VanZ family protein [Crocinitomicaceae bacterium]|nr:VanZ family protein [Crocinitomicaceae bacterium]
MGNLLRKHILWPIWLLVIFILSFTPGDKLPEIEWKLISVSTIAHFTMYSVLCFLMLFPFLEKNILNLSKIRLYLLVILVVIVIGFIVELIQGNFIYRRYYDPQDIIINGIGTVFGAFMYRLIGRKLV